MRELKWKLAIYIFLLGFIMNLLGIVAHVGVSAFPQAQREMFMLAPQ